MKREWHTSVPSDDKHGGWHWGARYRVGRLQIGYHLYRHCYYDASDRWVFHPQFVYDRKRKHA